MKFRSFFLCFLFLGGVPSLLAQSGGALTPASSPAPSMKTLTEIEPRTAISTVPYTISASGSYYLTKNLPSVTAGSGIVITASNVTLNLGGFTITGNNATGSIGVNVQGTGGSPLSQVKVTNGTITGFETAIEFQYVTQSTLSALHCVGSGIVLESYSSANYIHHCVISNAVKWGVKLDGSYNECSDNRLDHLTITNPGNTAIFLYGRLGSCNSNTITHCNITGGVAEGIFCYGSRGHCDYNTISHCSISELGSTGIFLNGVAGSCNGNTIHHCTLTNLGGVGIDADGKSELNDDQTGVIVGHCNGNLIKANTITQATQRGIQFKYTHRNRIEGNQVNGTQGDAYSYFFWEGGKNLIIKNVASYHSSGLVLNSADNTVGPIIETSGTFTNTGADVHPWANIRN